MTLLQRIETLVSEMRERAAALRAQMESASAEIAQRQDENVQLAEQLVRFEAERNAGEAREGLLQLESEQLRARLTELGNTVKRYMKPTVAKPAPLPLRRQIVGEVNVVIEGLAD